MLDYSQNLNSEYTDISEWQWVTLYTLTILCYRQAVQNSHNLPWVGVYTHISVWCTAVNITFATHCTWRNCWKHFLLVCRYMSLLTNTLFIAQLSWYWKHYILCAVYFSIMRPIKVSVHQFTKFSLVHDLSLDLWTTVILWCDQFPDWSFDDTTAASQTSTIRYTVFLCKYKMRFIP